MPKPYSLDLREQDADRHLLLLPLARRGPPRYTAPRVYAVRRAVVDEDVLNVADYQPPSHSRSTSVRHGGGGSAIPLPAIDVRDRYTGADVVATLTRACRDYGCPKNLQVENAPEFISGDLDLWAYMNGVTLNFSRPSKPTDNSRVAAFNGNVRAECIYQNWFLSLAKAQVNCEAFHRQQDPDGVYEINRRPQPADGLIGRKIRSCGGAFEAGQMISRPTRGPASDAGPPGRLN
jgi:transposase InsO family protein